MIMQKANTEAGLQLGSHKSLNSAHTRFVVIRAAPVIRPNGRHLVIIS
jgi:hypothetical protein